MVCVCDYISVQCSVCQALVLSLFSCSLLTSSFASPHDVGHPYKELCGRDLLSCCRSHCLFLVALLFFPLLAILACYCLLYDVLASQLHQLGSVLISCMVQVYSIFVEWLCDSLFLVWPKYELFYTVLQMLLFGVQLLFLCRRDRLWIAMEFCGGGSLQDIYHGQCM